MTPPSAVLTSTTAPAEVSDAVRLDPEPDAFGVRPAGDGVDVLVHAPHADAVELCLFDGLEGDGQPELNERRVRLHRSRLGRWAGHVPGVRPGQAYGLRVHGPWEPGRGLLHNANKVLLDPYARATTRALELAPEVFAHPVDSSLRPIEGLDRPDHRDSARHVPLAVVTDDLSAGVKVEHPRTPWSRTVVYEAHLRGLTMQLPGVPEHLRGTYAGLAHPATVAHLLGLGVTAVELLPIHAKADEPALTRRGATNYWGYNTLSYFAPEPSYATEAARAEGPHAVLAEVKGMVQLLHEAGLEVILDVVYNHTCEGGTDGPMLSWRGLDNAGYYLHDGPTHARYLDVTGCGNSLDFRSRAVVRMALDSLRYWSQTIGVDGFRFDLAVTLGRDGRHFDPDHPFLVALACDPDLAGLKLIAEPWDIGPHGWRTGQFPSPLAEWNDKFRDTVRTFWIADAAAAVHGGTGHDLRDLATRLSGSADLFAHLPAPDGRGPGASINYVTAHDGFTLADLVSYDVKHNEANGEGNHDGSDHNLSWNHGVEGSTDDPEVLAHRRRTMRNILGTLVLASGTPMLTAGDEFGRTQHGNNNAYCRNDAGVWVDWELEPWQDELLATTSHLLALRREHAALRPGRFHTPDPRDPHPVLAWYDEHGATMTAQRWHDPHRRVLQMYRSGHDPQSGSWGPDALLVINGAANPVRVTLTSAAAEQFTLVWDSAQEQPGDPRGESATDAGRTVEVPELSMRLYLST
ncbi:glycogen debranching protein GlgX [Ruania halotolerans]|uniref:glycogen debranching protein GlgX n=1 Tax=Ruania halotolerans TaxID=2897773 RepID=UPI001E346B64|nr:glycogen debranching protein GlgX [Ruania halotolerans]UFU07685.1 glycogen debranching protein GlgX [Ruania halotolerans]